MKEKLGSEAYEKAKFEKGKPCHWEGTNPYYNLEIPLPKTSTQFEFDRKLLPDLYDYLDTLGKNENS